MGFINMKSQVDKSAFKYLPALLMIPTHFRLPFSQQFPGSVISQRAVPFFFSFLYPQCRVHTDLCSFGSLCLCILFCNILFNSIETIQSLMFRSHVLASEVKVCHKYIPYLLTVKGTPVHFKAEAHGKLLRNMR